MNVDGYGVQEQCQSWLPLVRSWLAEKVRCKTETNMLGLQRIKIRMEVAA